MPNFPPQRINNCETWTHHLDIVQVRDKLKGSLPGFIGSHLLHDHGVLVAFTEYNRNVVRLEPPLICSRANVDQFISALDEVLGRGIVRIVKDFVKAQVR